MTSVNSERTFYTHKASKYNTEFANLGSVVGQERIRRRAYSLLTAIYNLLPGRNRGAVSYPIIEIGCDTGEYTWYVRESLSFLFHVTTDISLDMLKIAKQKIPNGVFVVADTAHLPFRSRSGQIVWGNAVLHHLPSLQQGLAEISRVLKPGGGVVFKEPNLLSPGKILAFVVPIRKLITPHRWSPDERPFTRKRVQETMKHSGFGCVQVQYEGLVTPRCPRWLANWLWDHESKWARIRIARWIMGALHIEASR